MKVIIVAGGNYEEDLVKSLINETEEDIFIIGADRGALSLIQSGIKIDLAIGDFDSVTEEERETINTYSREVVGLNPLKDATDLELAIDNALFECRIKRGYYNTIYLFAATGTRLDHTFANINLLYKVLKENDDYMKIKAYIIDGHNRIRLLDERKRHVFYKDQLFGKYVSFLPFMGKVDKVTLKGFKYETDEAEFTEGNSLGISNEAKEDMLSVYFESGKLLMFESRD